MTINKNRLLVSDQDRNFLFSVRKKCFPHKKIQHFVLDLKANDSQIKVQFVDYLLILNRSLLSTKKVPR